MARERQMPMRHRRTSEREQLGLWCRVSELFAERAKPVHELEAEILTAAEGDLHNIDRAIARGDAEVRRVPPSSTLMLEPDCDGLCGQHRTRIPEAAQRHEVPFERAFMLRQTSP